jgi:hypothetical protein
MFAQIFMAVWPWLFLWLGPSAGINQRAGPVFRSVEMAKEVSKPADRAAQTPAKGPATVPPGAQKPTGADPGGQIKTELVFLRLGDILLRPEEFCHRLKEELADDRVAGLMESVRIEKGIQVPVEVYYNADGQPVLVKGYRRVTSARNLAEQNVAGFSMDMPVPAVVVSGLSAQELLVRSVLDNENRKSLGPVERLLVAKRFYDAGVPAARAASALGVAEKTYQRDLRVAKRPWLVDLVRADKVAPSTAATLMEVVEKEGREAEFQEDLLQWVGRTEQRIHERERQRKADGKELTAAERLVETYLTRELVGRWLSDLRQGRRFEEKAEWSLPVSLEPKKGVLQIERTRIDLNGADVKDLARAAAKLSRVAKDMVKIIEVRSLLEESAGTAERAGDQTGLDLDFLRQSGLKDVADSIAEEFAADAGGGTEEDPAEGESPGDEGKATDGA